MVVGFDFDNTIVNYDAAFAEAACDAGVAGVSGGLTKRALRDVVRRQPGGEMLWRRLQAVVYGERMDRTAAHEGALACLASLRAAGVPTCIVSHKTAHASVDGRLVDLRGPATAWLVAHGCFDATGVGLAPARVFFENSRAEKLRRIGELGVTHFVDDLRETFTDPAFPAGVVRYLFAPDGEAGPEGVVSFTRWADIRGALLGAAAAPVAPADEIDARILELVGQPITRTEPLYGGRNSRVLSVMPAAGPRCVVKEYFDASRPGPSRLEAEVGALRFLEAAGVGCVPRVWRWASALALFEWVDGERLSSRTAGRADVEAMVRFLARLRTCSTLPEAVRLPPASDAALSITSFVSRIARRREALGVTPDDSAERLALHAFLADAFDPELARATAEASGLVGEHNAAAELPTERLTLSPSDVGLHNMLRRPDGSLVFLDFEYFGWDDPAKLCSDVLLHPAEPLNESQRAWFLSGALEAFGSVVGFRERLAAVYPLAGLMWVMILLNEFHPRELGRRRFAGEARADADVLRRQLDMARAMLDIVQQGWSPG